MTVDAGAIEEEAMRLLVGQTVADNRVFSPLDWDTYDGEYPVALVRVTQEDGVSPGEGRSAAQFVVTADLQITGRLQGKASVGDAGATVLRRQLRAFERQIKQALVNHPDLMGGLQGMPYLRSKADFNGEGAQHLAEVDIHIGLEYFAGPEDFYPIPVLPLADARLNDPAVFTGLPPLAVEADVLIPQST